MRPHLSAEQDGALRTDLEVAIDLEAECPEMAGRLAEELHLDTAVVEDAIREWYPSTADRLGLGAPRGEASTLGRAD